VHGASKELTASLRRQHSVNKKNYIVIDSNGEGWSFVPEHGVISPLTMLKQWSKLEDHQLLQLIAGEGRIQFQDTSREACRANDWSR
jgi:hypothetical protein